MEHFQLMLCSFGLLGFGRMGDLAGNGKHGPRIVLSASQDTEGDAQGTAIGIFSVVGGTGTYTFTLNTNGGGTTQVAGTNGVNLQVGATAPSVGTVTISAHADNGAGSTLDASFPIGTVPQAPTIALLAADDLGSSNSDNKTNINSPRFTITMNPSDLVVGTVIHVDDNGEIITHTVTQSDIDNGFTVNSYTFSDGSHPVTCKITVGGQTSQPSSTLNLFINTSISAPTIALDASTDTGTSGDKQTSSAAPVIDITWGTTKPLSGDVVYLRRALHGGTLAQIATKTLGSGDLTTTTITDSSGGLSAGSSYDYDVYVQRPDGSAFSALMASVYTVAIVAAPAMSYTPVTSATQGVAYTGATPSTSGGATPYVYSIHAGTLPSGFSLNTSTGVISGTDSGVETKSGIVLRVTDANGEVSDSTPFSITVSAAYTGPGDVQSGAWAYWGLRAYTAAYAGGSNPAMDITDSAGSNLTTINFTASGYVDASAISTFITAHGTPSVKKLYDQTGNGRHLINPNPTVSAWPTISLSIVNGYPAIVLNGSQTLITSASYILAQPFTEQWSAQRTANFTSFGGVLGRSTVGSGFGNSSSHGQWNDGTNLSLAGFTDSAWCSFTGSNNGASTRWTVNGSTIATASPGTTGMATVQINLGTLGGSKMTGYFLGGGYWDNGGVALSDTVIGNLNSNARAAFGGL